MAHTITQSSFSVRGDVGRFSERPILVDAQAQMNLLAATDDALKLLDAALRNWSREFRVFASLRKQLEAKRNDLVASSLERDRA